MIQVYYIYIIISHKMYVLLNRLQTSIYFVCNVVFCMLYGGFIIIYFLWITPSVFITCLFVHYLLFPLYCLRFNFYCYYHFKYRIEIILDWDDNVQSRPVKKIRLAGMSLHLIILRPSSRLISPFSTKI